MKQTINCALIGAGRIGKVHASNIASVGGRLTHVFDVDAQAAAMIASMSQARISSLEEIWASDVEAVIIASSTDTHADLIEAASRAGKHIFCEKPIDLSLDRVALCLASVKEKVKLQIGFNRRFDPNFFAIKQAIEANSIGDIQSIHIISRDPNPPSESYLRRSGGLFKDMMIHDFDMARWLISDEFLTMQSQVTQEGEVFKKVQDYNSAMVSFKSKRGILGHITNHRQTSYGYDQRIEVFGSQGKLMADNVLANSVKLVNRSGTNLEKPKAFFLERYSDAYRLELETFFECIAEDKPVPVTGYDGYMALKLAVIAEQSAKTGLTVNLNQEPSAVKSKDKEQAVV